MISGAKLALLIIIALLLFLSMGGFNGLFVKNFFVKGLLVGVAASIFYFTASKLLKK